MGTGRRECSTDQTESVLEGIEMGLNFRKSLSIGKLFRINFSKSGIGVSAGVKGARISVGKNGVRETISLPGTGLSWSEQQSFKKIKKAVTGRESEKVSAKPKKNNKWLQLIWVAVVAGAFMLYQSGALDSVIMNVKNAFSGKPQASAVTSADAPTAVSAEASAMQASAASSEPAASQTNQGASGPQVVQLKDGQKTLAASTLYIASKSGGKFHHPDCSVIKSIASANLVEFETRDAAVEAKKAPCSICNP